MLVVPSGSLLPMLWICALMSVLTEVSGMMLRGRQAVHSWFWGVLLTAGTA
jgi:hypothetical protein